MKQVTEGIENRATVCALSRTLHGQFSDLVEGDGEVEIIFRSKHRIKRAFVDQALRNAVHMNPGNYNSLFWRMPAEPKSRVLGLSVSRGLALGHLSSRKPPSGAAHFAALRRILRIFSL